MFGAFGGRVVAAETVADGIDIFGSGLEIFVGHNAAGFVGADAGVFEPAVGAGFGAGSQHNAINADHFVFGSGFEDDAFCSAVIFEGDYFGVGNNHDAEFGSEVFAESLTGFGVFFGQESGGLLHNNNFGAEFSKVFGDFAAGGATANNENELGLAPQARHGIGGEAFDAFESDDTAG